MENQDQSAMLTPAQRTGAPTYDPNPEPAIDAVTPDRPPDGVSVPGTVEAGPVEESARRSSRRSSRSHRSHRDQAAPLSSREISRTKRRHELWATRVIAAAAVTAAVILSMMLIRANSKIAAHGSEAGSLASALTRTQGELQQTKQLVAAQEVELSALTKQRIPGVSNLDIDKLYDINQRYVKKLSFSEAGVGAEKRLTYYAVLKNTTEAPVTPAVSIMLFDRKGLQTGMAHVTREASTTPTEREQLQPGETRAYSAAIPVIRPEEPVYFLVEAQ
jgi:hypothetical protein